MPGAPLRKRAHYRRVPRTSVTSKNLKNDQFSCSGVSPKGMSPVLEGGMAPVHFLRTLAIQISLQYNLRGKFVYDFFSFFTRHVTRE